MSKSLGQHGLMQKLVNLMPPHDVYIETHLGSGVVMRNKRLAKRNIGIDIDSKVINCWDSNNRNDIELIHDNAVQYLKRFQFKGQELVYCNPPYLSGTEKKTQLQLFSHISESNAEQHKELLEVLKSLPCMVMISSHDSELYNNSLKGWHLQLIRPYVSPKSGKAIWAWLNYSPPVELHDYRYLGDTFRQREKIKIKTAVWVRKFQRMSILERQAVISAIKAICK